MWTFVIASIILVSATGCSDDASLPVIFDNVEFADGVTILRLEERGEVECVVFESRDLEWCGQSLGPVDQPVVVGVSGAGAGAAFEWIAVGIAPLGSNAVVVEIDGVSVVTSTSRGPEFAIWIAQLETGYETSDWEHPIRPDVRVRAVN